MTPRDREAVMLLPAPIPQDEEGFRRLVRSIARMRGWQLQYHTADSRRSDRGWVDDVFGHPLWHRTLFVESKSAKGRVRPEQRLWLRHLHACGFEVALWRPGDIDEIVQVLGPARRRATLPPAFLEATTL